MCSSPRDKMNGGLLSDFGRDLSDSRTPRSHASVVHAMEVAFFPKLVPGALGFFGYDPHLVELLLEGYYSFVEVLVSYVNIRYGIGIHLRQLPLLLEVVPLTIKII